MTEPPRDMATPGWWQRLGKKDRSRILTLLTCLIAGVALMASSAWLGAADETAPAPTPPATAAAADTLETRLSATLSQIKGAGDVWVVITYSSSAAAVYATEQTSSVTHSGTDEQNEQEQSLAVVGDAPVLVREDGAQVQGVLVVAGGAGDPIVKERLYLAVKALLNINADCIAIIEGRP